VSNLSIRRAHALEHAEAHRRISKVADKLSERFGATCQWQGDVLRIEHPNVNGTVRVGRDEIVVDARLGFALSLLRGRAEAEITRILERELEG
jgi:putative polyhydroxyalkanoate system protein